MRVTSAKVAEHVGSDREVRPGPITQFAELGALIRGLREELPLKLPKFARTQAAPRGHARVRHRREERGNVQYLGVLQWIQEVQRLLHSVVGIVWQADHEGI